MTRIVFTTGCVIAGLALALPDGDLLVSMRNTWAVYLIDPSTGRIIWTLGGKDSAPPNGNALIGWGSEPYFSEYSSSGRRLVDVEWPGEDQSYRALFTDTWVGTPYYPPRGAVRGDTVYASWNGATEVAKWEVLAGSSRGHLRAVARHGRTGFETAISLARGYRVYEVCALDARGGALGTSKAFR